MAEQASSYARPRPDDTPPRNRVIAAYTALAVMTLIGLKFVFDSYLDASRRSVRTEQLRTSQATAALEEYRERQRERLAGGAMPIERAMSELARRGRNAFPLIRPAPSQDLDPLRGWAQLPREPAAAGPTLTASSPAASSPAASSPAVPSAGSSPPATSSETPPVGGSAVAPTPSGAAPSSATPAPQVGPSPR